MRRFVYMCLVLPTLSLSAGEKNQTKQEKKNLLLKSATVFSREKDNPSPEFQKGRCYIFDEATKALTLEGVRYQLDSNNELIVDIKVNQEEQKALSALSKKLSKKRHLVVTVNNQVVSTPTLEGGDQNSGVQMTVAKNSEISTLIKALSS